VGGLLPLGESPVPRRSYQIPLLVIAVAAAGFNLRTAITSLPPLFPDLQTRLHLSSATLSLLAATPSVTSSTTARKPS
jgi:cyanate permease